MARLKNILVAVGNPSSRTQRALAKAAQLAQAAGARLELYHAISEPLYTDPALFGPKTLIQHETEIRAGHLERLERLARPLRERGLAVSCSATWDFPAADAIVRHAAAKRSDLIVVDSRGSHAGRWFLRFTDWELLRLSPIPVLLVRGSRPYTSPTILAALDPMHTAAKPAKLDAEILSAAGELQRVLGGKLHAMHAYVPGAIGLRPEQMARAGFAERLEKRTRSRAARALASELKAAKVADATVHLVALHPVNAIPATARKTGAAITVMGAISRSGLRRLFIGNTAEQVINDLRSDVLVVKPRRFPKPKLVRERGPDLRAMMLPNYV